MGGTDSMVCTVEQVHQGHPRDHQKWLLQGGDLIAEVEMYTLDLFGTHHPAAIEMKPALQ